MTRIVGMHEAKTHFSRLVRLAAAGTEIIVSNDGVPVAKIVGYTPSPTARTPGMLAGQIDVEPGFDDLPAEFAEAFDATA